MTAEILGPLRGRLPPPEHVLVRLAQISAAFRVTWTPATARRPGMWWIHEVKPQTPGDALRREAGRRKLARAEKWPAKWREERVAELWQAEDFMLGYYPTGMIGYSDAEFGTERMLRDLARAQAALEQAEREARWAALREQTAAGDVREEMEANPEFSAFVRDVASDYYFSVSGGALVPVTGLKETAYDRTDGQSMAGSRHEADREPGQPAGGSDRDPDQGQVREGDPGGGEQPFERLDSGVLFRDRRGA